METEEAGASGPRTGLNQPLATKKTKKKARKSMAFADVVSNELHPSTAAEPRTLVDGALPPQFNAEEALPPFVVQLTDESQSPQKTEEQVTSGDQAECQPAKFTAPVLDHLTRRSDERSPHGTSEPTAAAALSGFLEAHSLTSQLGGRRNTLTMSPTRKALSAASVGSATLEDKHSTSKPLLYIVLALCGVVAVSVLLVMEGNSMAEVNLPLVTALLGPLLAQACKPFTHLLEHGVWVPSRALGSGGMPSGHSACAVGLSVSIGITSGWHSSEFAISFAVALIVLYDACHVRLESEHHAHILNELALSLPPGHSVRALVRARGGEQGLKEKVGHYKSELVGGSIVGVTCAILMELCVGFRK